MCSRAHGTMPSPSVRRHRGPDELVPKVRTKVFVDVTVPWDTPEVSRRVHVLAAPCLPHPRGDTEVRTNCYQRSGRKYLSTAACRGMRRSCQGVFTCSRNPAVTIREETRRSGRTVTKGQDEGICRRHRPVGCARAAKACSRARGTLPSPSARRHGGPDELLPKVRTKVFVDGTVPWDAPELPRRVHVLAAHCRHHPRHGTGTTGRNCSPRSGQRIFVLVTLPWDAFELPRRVHVLSAPCRNHP